VCVAPHAGTDLESFFLGTTNKWRRNTTVITRRGDISKIEADAIVVPHDAAFGCRDGLSRVIRVLDPEAIAEAQQKVLALKGVSMARPIYTASPSEQIVARGMYHVVGPVASQHEAQYWLTKTFQSCILAAAADGNRSLVFPAIGTGGAGFSDQQCATAFFSAIAQCDATEIAKVSSITILLTRLPSLEAFRDASRMLVTHVE